MKIKRRRSNNLILWLVVAMISLFCVAGGMYYSAQKNNLNKGKNSVKVKEEVSLRTGPDEDYPVLTIVSSGADVIKVSETGTWYEVETNSKYLGWIPGWTIENSNIKSPDDQNKEKLANYTVVLNPEINDKVAADYTGKNVKSYNLDIAQNLQKKLQESGIKVVLTRTDDNTIPTKEDIKKVAIDNKAELLIDISAINNTKDKFGVQIFYNDAGSTRLAKYIERNITKKYIGKMHSAQKDANIVQVSEKLPQLKIIAGNLSDKVDVDILNNEFYKNQYVAALESGIEDYLYYLIGIENYNSKRKEQLLNLPQKGLNIPKYYTQQENYKNIKYGTDNSKTIEKNGDAIVSLAMISKYLSGNEAQSVENIASWAGVKYYISGQGTAPTIVTAFADKYNYKTENVTLDEFDKVKEAVKNNKPVLVRLKSGMFGRKATYKVIRGFEDDKFYLNDPDDDDVKLNSYNGFTENDIKTNIAQGWIFSK